MNRLIAIERFCLWGHVVSMAFGLAGLLWVMPHPEFLDSVPAGPLMFRWSMAGGGVVYIVLGAIAVGLYGYRLLGLRALLGFLIPALTISLSSELLGTSTGFPFGHYSYLNGLGYKIAGLVPFTIPLSWFYLGFCAYLLARCGLSCQQRLRDGLWLPTGVWQIGSILLGAGLLTSWDFVLDPAMSQTAMPFWFWHRPGAFFGMPYQNFAGWLGTGALFMSVTAFLWRGYLPIQRLTRSQLATPLAVYLANFAFAMLMSLGSGITVPVLLGLAAGAIPAVLCWYMVMPEPVQWPEQPIQAFAKESPPACGCCSPQVEIHC
ncbi:MAG: carotenoid biosynthesis protein [Leptolyngbyaceae cyanobacterium SM1_1_3]|nr:carotenoid biosynthesis protein [Leptolyngbyaceae cyanobacterium SM1_1_3]